MINREQFSGPVDVRWLTEHERDMMLLADITFTDSKGRKWNAYKWDIINGLSIPKFLWSIVGSPFVGLARRSSVLHDVECQRKNRIDQEVHDCFKEMMVADGVDDETVDTLYNAVNNFGPRW